MLGDGIRGERLSTHDKNMGVSVLREGDIGLQLKGRELISKWGQLHACPLRISGHTVVPGETSWLLRAGLMALVLGLFLSVFMVNGP